MQTTYRLSIASLVIAFILCVPMLTGSGSAFGQQCVDNEDGTVTDNTVGLIWWKDSDGPMNWDEAMSYVGGRTLGGYSSFRLPSRNELQGLYHSPCLEDMSVESDWYWSSTTEPDYTACAWGVNFGNGEVHCGRKTHDVYVRAVRTSQ